MNGRTFYYNQCTDYIYIFIEISSCIRTYQVHYRRTATDGWQPLNQLHNPFMSYHHRASHNQTTHGLYAVQAIDLAGRPGRLSPPIQYTNVNT